MKKIICFLYLIIMCFCLCSCDPGTYTINPNSLEGVKTIELIDYKNPDQKRFASWVPNHFEDLKPFDTAKATVIEILQEERKSDFLDAFMQTNILHKCYAYDSPVDICIRLNYENGNFLIIWSNYKKNSSAGYIGEYSADGTVLSFWGSFSGLSYYQGLINNFFSYNI
ncbi:MAG: hypothetical protein IJA89_07800 [Clostridia bacterium]|nr:hypothetical protein [Clostridia bacterium]